MSTYLKAEGVDVAQTRTAYGELQQLNAKYGELAADAGLAAGGALPPPFGTAADALSLGRSVWKGDWGGALFDLIGFVPLLGDGAKAAKIANKLDDLRRAVDVAAAGVARNLDKTKAAAGKYWDDVAKKKRAAYDEAIKECGTNKACRDANAKLKGDQYKTIPNDGPNGKWSGERGDGVWVPSDGSPPIPYRNGFPDYSGVTKGDVDIPMRGNHSTSKETGDFGLAEKAYLDKYGKLPDGYDKGDFTWHHHENGVTMQLVPKKSHTSARHTGGVSVHKGSHAAEF